MADERISVNAGGQVFLTTASTLKTSGAGYFEKLLGETGEAMTAGKKKRARAEPAADAPPSEVFLDRDPGCFRDVLAFMRSNRIPAAAARDRDRLLDLKAEGAFLCYDRLEKACDEALDVSTQVDALEAHCHCLFVAAGPNGERGMTHVINHGIGEVVYITKVLPRANNDADRWDLRLRNKDTVAVSDDGSQHGGITIAQYFIRHDPGRCDKGFMHTDLNVAVEGEDGKVCLDASGAGWNVVAWVGPPCAIPGLGGPRTA